MMASRKPKVSRLAEEIASVFASRHRTLEHGDLVEAVRGRDVRTGRALDGDDRLGELGAESFALAPEPDVRAIDWWW